jgi:hypothetical protein
MRNKGVITMLKMGDKVEMHTCWEADYYKGKVWTCTSDEFTSLSGEQVVFLGGFRGYFATKFLKLHEHEFKGREYSKLLGRWVTYCNKCGLIKED